MKINRLSSMLLVHLLATNTFAATPPDSGQLLRESEPPAIPVPLKELPKIQAPQVEAPEAPSAVKVKVGGFIFSGNTVFDAKELGVIMAEFVGQEMSLTELNMAIKKIVQAYREKGYFLATALIPPQSIKPGEPITIEIIEGILEDVKLHSEPAETRTPKRLLEAYISHVPLGQPVEERTLTSMAMRVNDLPGINSRIVMEPGDQRGTTKAKLQVVEGKPYRAYLDTDNHGNYSTGYYRVGGGFELYSPLKLGDRFNLRVQSATSGDTQNVKAGYSLPASAYGTRVGFDYQWLTYELGRDFSELEAEGVAQNFVLTVSHPLVRNRDLVLDTTFSGEYVLLDDQVKKFQIDNDRHATEIHLGLSGVKLDTLGGGGSTSFNAVATAGKLKIDDAQAQAGDQAPGGLDTEGHYEKLNLSLSRHQNVYQRLVLYVGGYAQLTDRNLDSAEHLGLGGPKAVRAYPVGEASADAGYVVTAELRYQVGRLGPVPGNFQLTAFIDDARAWFDHDPVNGSDDNHRHLTGVGIGCNWFDYDNFSVTTSLAWRTTEPSISDPDRSDNPLAYFQVVKMF